VTDAWICRLLPLICLAIMDGRQPNGLRLAEMLGTGLLYGAFRGRPGTSAIDTACSERFGLGAAQLVPKLKQTAGQRESQPVCSVIHGSRRVEQVT
jgi:hypothetical protein